MAKSNSFFILIGAVSGLLLTAFFIMMSLMPQKASYQRTRESILLSYIPPLEYVGAREYLSRASLQQPQIFDVTGFQDSFLELESFNPIIDSVIHIPDQFRLKRKV